jgi:hypothetical protein
MRTLHDCHRRESARPRWTTTWKKTGVSAGGHNIEFDDWITGEDVLYVSEFARWCESLLIGERHSFSETGLTGRDARAKNMSKSAMVPPAEIREVVRFGIAKTK